MATKKTKKTTKPSTKPKKKVPAKKIKVPPKKKAIKAIPNPHVGKRYFMVELGGNGGELIVGTASEQFVEYWLDKDRKDNLNEHLHAMHEMALNGIDISELENMDDENNDYEGYDKNSPEVYEGCGIREYWNLDDLEHSTMVSDDYGGHTVSEIELNPMAVYKDGEISFDDKYTSKKNFDWSTQLYTVKEGTEREITIDKTLYSRELFLEDTKKGIKDPVPAVMLYDSQKGVFGRVYVMTDGEDFDVNKLAKTVIENTMATNVERYFYDRRPLQVDHNDLSTWGKGYYMSVGYLHKWDVDYDVEAYEKEGWENLEAE